MGYSVPGPSLYPCRCNSSIISNGFDPSGQYYNIGFRVASIPELTPGDGNGDGHVDGVDYLIWAGNYGDNPADDPPGSARQR
jgi:hypothetical protein